LQATLGINGGPNTVRLFQTGGTALALQGSLDTFSLPDVLRLLATTSKTGRLRIEGDRGRGSVWLRDGGVIDAHADRTLDGTPREEVVFELLRFDRGTFDFDGDDAGSSGGEPDDVEALLTRADVLLSEWSELEAVVPSLEHEVTLAGDLSADEVTIGADSWRSLVAVSSGRTVGELATTLGLTELGVSRAVRDLVDLGVVEVSRSPAPRTAASRTPSAPSRSASPAADDRPRRQPTSPGPDSVGAPVISPAGSSPRAGWITERTGEIPATPDPGDAPNQPSHGRDVNVGARADEPPAPPAPPAPPERPAPADPAPTRSGLTSRLGRNRNGSAAARNGASPPVAEPSANGAPPSRPADEPTARADDIGRGRVDNGARPRRSAGEPTRPAPSTPFEDGPLGPPPVGPDTGPMRSTPPSPRPSDLPWAGDDALDVTNTGGPSSPFAGLSNLGPGAASPTGPARPVGDGEVLPHVAAMSPEAQAAVQRTVGPSGGSQGGPAAQNGGDTAQRGRLISFLSSIR
jgi:hypothetical protein